MAASRSYKNPSDETKREFKDEVKRVRDELGLGEAMADPLRAAGVDEAKAEAPVSKDGV